MISTKRYVIAVAVDIMEPTEEDLESGGIIQNWVYRVGGIWGITRDRFSARFFNSKESAQIVANDYFSSTLATVQEVELTLKLI